jgi:hypothetical protein
MTQLSTLQRDKQLTPVCSYLGDRLTVDPTNPAYAAQSAANTGYQTTPTYSQTPTQTASNPYPNTNSQTGGPTYAQPTTHGYVANTPYPQQSTANGAASSYSTQGTAAYPGSYTPTTSNPQTYTQPASNVYPSTHQQQQQVSYPQAGAQSGVSSYPNGTPYLATTTQSYNTMSQPTYTQSTQGGQYFYQSPQ